MFVLATSMDSVPRGRARTKRRLRSTLWGATERKEYRTARGWRTRYRGVTEVPVQNLLFSGSPRGTGGCVRPEDRAGPTVWRLWREARGRSLYGA